MRPHRSLVAACLGVLVVAVAVAPATVTVLYLQDPRTGAPVGAERVTEGERFAIHYVHSYEGTPINEVYEVRGTRIVQVREEFQYYAVGLEYTNRNRTRQGNRTVLHMNRRFERFDVRVAKATNQSLLIDGQRRPLTRYAPRWETVRFSIRRMSYAEYFLVKGLAALNRPGRTASAPSSTPLPETHEHRPTPGPDTESTTNESQLRSGR